MDPNSVTNFLRECGLNEPAICRVLEHFGGDLPEGVEEHKLQTLSRNLSHVFRVASAKLLGDPTPSSGILVTSLADERVRAFMHACLLAGIIVRVLNPTSIPASTSTAKAEVNTEYLRFMKFALDPAFSVEFRPSSTSSLVSLGKELVRQLEPCLSVDYKKLVFLYLLLGEPFLNEKGEARVPEGYGDFDYRYQTANGHPEIIVTRMCKTIGYLQALQYFCDKRGIILHKGRGISLPTK